MRRHPFIWIAVGILLASAAMPTSAAGPLGTVTGSITILGQKTALIQPYVDESPNDFIVVLASKAIPRDVIPFIGEEVARKQKIHAVVFTIDRAKRALGSTFTGVFYPGTEMGFVGTRPESLTLQLTRLDATGVEGRIFTPKPVKLSDVSYSFDATFAIPLGKAAPPPPPIQVKISGDTSAPSQAFAEYYRAVLAGDAQKVRNGMAAERRAAFDKASSEERGMMLDLMKSNPAEIAIGKPALKGTTATLSIEGKNETSGKSTAQITMIQEGGVWKVRQEKWSTSSK
jgi:hypothetical protein